MHQRWSRILGVAIIFMVAAALYFGVLTKTGANHDRFSVFDLLRGESPPLTEAGEGITPSSKPPLRKSQVRHLEQLNAEYAALTKAVVPSVVSLRTSRTVNVQRLHQTNEGVVPQNERMREPGLGSGVIVTREGHVITNHHVISNVDEIEVTLHNGRKYPAEFIDSDPQTDVAVLKILAPPQPDGEPAIFPSLPMGDSDKVRVGEMVISVGNPFGLSETVTSGMISNRARRITDMSVSFLQSDTVINPGSSGGPLLNVRGEIVGITTDLFLGQAGLRTWQGIALAIPVNDVRDSFETVMSRGEFGRGYLGIVAEEMLPEIANQLNLPPYRGALVLDVLPDSPAEKAGLKTGDIILSFAGKEIDQGSNLMRSVRQQQPGAEITLGILRGGAFGTMLELNATIAQRSAEVSLEQPLKNPDARISDVAGIKVRSITAEEKELVGLMPTSSAVVVTALDPLSDIALGGGIQPGDLIHEVNRVAVNSPEEFYAALDRMPVNERSILLVARKGTYGFLMLVPRLPTGETTKAPVSTPAPASGTAPAPPLESDKPEPGPSPAPDAPKPGSP